MLTQRYQHLGEAHGCLENARSAMATTTRTCSARPGMTPRTKPTPTGTALGVSAPSHGPDTWLSDAALAGLLVPLCAATDALARLDARAAASPNAVRDGLRARMATAEAAGWLAHAHAWVHPLDLSLRAAGLTASAALAAVGHGPRSLPQTFAGPADPLDWADPPFDAMADGDRANADALSLVRLLCRLPGRPTASPFATPITAAAALEPLGAGDLDPARLAAWWTAHAPAPPVARRYGSRGGEGTREKTLPPLLAVARAAQDWMEAGLTDRPDPLHALLAAIGRHAGQGPAHTVFLPVWAAYPAVGFSGRDLSASGGGKRADGAARTRPAGSSRRAGQGGRGRQRQTLAAARRARRAAAHTGANAEGTCRAAQGGAADRDGVAAGAAGQGGGPGGDRAGEFPGVRHLTVRHP
jgi:hypothetical protein